jgi:hypothetical protein
VTDPREQLGNAIRAHRADCAAQLPPPLRQLHRHGLPGGEESALPESGRARLVAGQLDAEVPAAMRRIRQPGTPHPAAARSPGPCNRNGDTRLPLRIRRSGVTHHHDPARRLALMTGCALPSTTARSASSTSPRSTHAPEVSSVPRPCPLAACRSTRRARRVHPPRRTLRVHPTVAPARPGHRPRRLLGLAPSPDTPSPSRSTCRHTWWPTRTCPDRSRTRRPRPAPSARHGSGVPQTPPGLGARRGLAAGGRESAVEEGVHLGAELGRAGCGDGDSPHDGRGGQVTAEPTRSRSVRPQCGPTPLRGGSRPPGCHTARPVVNAA